MKGLSCVMGNYHAQFLGGLGPEMAPGYPVFESQLTQTLSSDKKFIYSYVLG